MWVSDCYCVCRRSGSPTVGLAACLVGRLPVSQLFEFDGPSVCLLGWLSGFVAACRSPACWFVGLSVGYYGFRWSVCPSGGRTVFLSVCRGRAVDLSVGQPFGWFFWLSFELSGGRVASLVGWVNGYQKSKSLCVTNTPHFC